MFFGFRVMVGMGVLMLLIELARLVAVPPRAAGTPSACRARCCGGLPAMTSPAGSPRVAGWYVTEIGRQPFIVLRPAAHRRRRLARPAPMIALTLALYVVLYLALIVAYVAVLKYMAEKPEEVLATTPASAPPRRPARSPRPVAEGSAA